MIKLWIKLTNYNLGIKPIAVNTTQHAKYNTKVTRKACLIVGAISTWVY